MTTFKYFGRAGKTGYYHTVTDFDGYALTSHRGRDWTAHLVVREGQRYGQWEGKGTTEEKALRDLARQFDTWKRQARVRHENSWQKFSNPWSCGCV